MLNKLAQYLDQVLPAPPLVHAHCDGPCGIYDPAAARIHAEAVLSMTKKLLDLKKPAPNEGDAHRAYLNTFIRYLAIKEDEAHKCKQELLILWTDYFKPPQLEKYPYLHDLFWQAAKLCSACKVEVNLEKANALLETVKKVHALFWATKDRAVPWVTAG